jgi:hypothetical protein
MTYILIPSTVNHLPSFVMQKCFKICGDRPGPNHHTTNVIITIIIIIIYFMELGHLLARSGLTYPEVSSKLYHDSFCQLGSGISLPWVIYFEAVYLHVVSSFPCIPVICPKLVLFFNSFAICVFDHKCKAVYILAQYA